MNDQQHLQALKDLSEAALEMERVARQGPELALMAIIYEDDARYPDLPRLRHERFICARAVLRQWIKDNDGGELQGSHANGEPFERWERVVHKLREAAKQGLKG